MATAIWAVVAEWRTVIGPQALRQEKVIRGGDLENGGAVGDQLDRETRRLREGRVVRRSRSWPLASQARYARFEDSRGKPWGVWARQTRAGGTVSTHACRAVRPLRVSVRGTAAIAEQPAVTRSMMTLMFPDQRTAVPVVNQTPPTSWGKGSKAFEDGFRPGQAAGNRVATRSPANAASQSGGAARIPRQGDHDLEIRR